MMYCIIKDLMNGNPNLPEGCEEENGRTQRHRRRLPGSETVDRPLAELRLSPEAVLNSSFDFTGKKEPMTFATENDVLNGISMLFMRLLTNRAQIFADVRTFWSPEATKRVTGYDFEGHAKENGGIIHLLNSGAACLDACGECTEENSWQCRHEEMVGGHGRGHQEDDRRDRLVRGRLRQLPRRRLLQPLRYPRGNARDHDPPEPRQGLGPACCRSPRAGLCICPRRSPTRSWSAPTPHGPAHGSPRAATARRVAPLRALTRHA